MPTKNVHSSVDGAASANIGPIPTWPSHWGRRLLHSRRSQFGQCHSKTSRRGFSRERDMSTQVAHAVLAKNSKSFALAGRLLPAQSRDDAAVLYAWCRRADDAIDNGSKTGAHERLVILRRELDSVYEGVTQTDVHLDLFQELVQRRGIQKAHPLALLDGFAMDLGIVRFQTITELLLYSYRVAGVVGLMMCPILGMSDPRAYRHAVHLGIAMQLTNICRDVKEDWERSRLYLPEEILVQVGAPELGIRLGQSIPEEVRPQLALAVRRVLDLAERYYVSGDEGLPYLPTRAAIAIRTARQVYSAIGCEIACRGWDVLQGRAVVSGQEKLRLVLCAVFGELLARMFSSLGLFGFVTPEVPNRGRGGAHAPMQTEGLIDGAFILGV
jgi:15-cis-phytoene synthase